MGKKHRKFLSSRSNMNLMRSLSTFLCSIIIILIISCAEKTPDPRLEQPEEFKQVLDAHGDWNKWIDSKAFSYTMIHETNLTQENHFFNLDSRKGRIDAQNFQIGFDGEKVWISPNRQAFAGNSVRFYHNLYFYFFSIPYIFTDPGVNVKKVDNKTLNGEEFEAFEVSFDEGKGDSPEDQYVMLVDSETKRLQWLLYTVTFFDQSNSQFNALKYEDYRDAGGLVFPRIMTGYTLEGDSTGRIRYQVSFSDVVLSEDPLNEDIFEMPEKQAVVAN